MKSLAIAEAEAPVMAGAVVAQTPAVVPVARHRDLNDSIARVVVVVLFTFLSVNIGMNVFETGRLTAVLLLLSEALVVVLTVVRRTPAAVDRSIRARVLTAISVVGPPLVRPSALVPFVPDSVTIAISAVGLLVVAVGKISLGRSFGLIPANRGIVSTGLYRMVRHPIYLGYLITHVGFLVAHPTTWNIGLLIVADLALLARAVCEERTLAKDEKYREYQSRVRWRILPGVF